MISSPSWRNFRLPVGRTTGSAPRFVSSSMDPHDPGSGPDRVRSRKGHRAEVTAVARMVREHLPAVQYMSANEAKLRREGCRRPRASASI